MTIPSGESPPPAVGSGQHPGDPEEDRTTTWRRLLRMGAPRATKANVFATVLALLLGFALATQVHQTRSGGLESLRQTDLVGLLDDVSQRSHRLDKDAAELRVTRDQLVNGGAGDAAALKAAQARLNALGVLAGTVPAQGPGITMVIADPEHKVADSVLLDALQELRDAGAEAVQIGPVRVVASTSFSTSPAGAILVDGVGIHPPYRILAIGDAHTIAAAMDIPGGLAETVRQLGGTPTVTQSTSIRITALSAPREHRYAHPVPSATATP